MVSWDRGDRDRSGCVCRSRCAPWMWYLLPLTDLLLLQWISFFYAKLCLILENRVLVGSTWNFQEVLSSVCFIPQNGKEIFLAKKRYLSPGQAMDFGLFRNHAVWKKHTVGKRTVLSILWKKKTRGPREPSFSRKKMKQKLSEKLKMTFFNHFHQGSHKMIIALSSACAQSKWQPEVDRARRVQLIELAAGGRYPVQFSYRPSVTGHTWLENAPQSPQKNGVGGYW